MNRIKLYSIFTEETNLLKDIFQKSLKDDWEIILTDWDKTGEDGNWGTQSFGTLMRKKVNYMIEVVEKNIGNIIIFSDIDIQFFKKCNRLIEKSIENNDILFQSENWPEKRINAGFIVIRCNEKTIEFFREVSKVEFEKLRYFEQSAMSEILEKNTIGLRWDILPAQFWAMSHRLAPPHDIVLHHANCTEPIIRDGRKVGSIELKLEQYKIVKDYLKSKKI